MKTQRSVSQNRGLDRTHQSLIPTHSIKIKLNKSILTKEQIDQIIAEVKNEKLEENKCPAQPTSSFLSVSREKYAFAMRNHTESPRSTHYTPRYKAIRPRTRSALRFHNPATTPKERRLQPLGSFTMTPLPQRLQQANQSDNEVLSDSEDMPTDLSAIIRKRHVLPRFTGRETKGQAFGYQISRPERKERQEKRGFLGTAEIDTPVLSTNKKIPGVPFSILTHRKDILVDHPQPEYDPKKDAVSPRTGTLVLQFEKLTPRKSLALVHILSSPGSPALHKLEKGWKQVFKREPTLPTMQNLSPRDDRMYRVLGMYALNVPKKQLMTDPPRYFGDPLQQVKKFPYI